MDFDGYRSSLKDHDHIRCTKNSCCNLQIRPDMIHLTPREKFMDNTHNKSELISLISSTLQKHQIAVEQCNNHADTSIVRAAIAATTDGSVGVNKLLLFDVFYVYLPSGAGRRCRHPDNAGTPCNPLFLTTSKGSYNVRGIRETLSERQRHCLLFSRAFTGWDTVSAIGSHGKTNLLDKFCA